MTARFRPRSASARTRGIPAEAGRDGRLGPSCRRREGTILRLHTKVGLTGRSRRGRSRVAGGVSRRRHGPVLPDLALHDRDGSATASRPTGRSGVLCRAAGLSPAAVRPRLPAPDAGNRRTVGSHAAERCWPHVARRNVGARPGPAEYCAVGTRTIPRVTSVPRGRVRRARRIRPGSGHSLVRPAAREARPWHGGCLSDGSDALTALCGGTTRGRRPHGALHGGAT
jgi:hypothetical protein